MKWAIIKSIAAHIAGDYGFQTARQAKLKHQSPSVKLEHCTIVACSHGIAALSGEGEHKLLYVLLNFVSHFIIDSFNLPKWIDQTLHISIAGLTGLMLCRHTKVNSS